MELLTIQNIKEYRARLSCIRLVEDINKVEESIILLGVVQ